MITLGSWPDWVAAIFTSLAFVVAAFSYRRSVKVRREAQARLIYADANVNRWAPGDRVTFLAGGATFGAGEGYSPEEDGHGNMVDAIGDKPVIRATVTIHNESHELVGPVKVELVDPTRGTRYARVHAVVGPVEPRNKTVCELTVIATDEWSSAVPTILFRDASGAWWRRTSFEPVEHVHDDPANVPRDDPNRGPSARKTGMLWTEARPDTKPGNRTRWHRFWRRMRGKSPIP